MYNDVTGIILAGGKSSRMGKNKALLEFAGGTLIENTVSLMRSLFKNVILITNDPAEYGFLKIKTSGDVIPGKGPLSGVHAGLAHSITERNFIISCDLPFMSGEMISFITDYRTDKPITVVKADGFIQQLCGIYSRSCLNKSEELLKHQDNYSKCKVLSLIENAGASIIDAESINCYKEGMFLNVNTREDYGTALSKLIEVASK